MKHPARSVMAGTRSLAGFLCLLLAAGLAAAARADEAGELPRTWAGSWVFAPGKNAAGFTRLSVADLPDYRRRQALGPRAVVLYAHGCDGLSEISAASGRFLAQHGYLVVEPNGFARTDKPASCKPAKHLGGLHRAVLGWRQDEMRYAAAKLRAIGPLGDLPLILMGHSEGAIAVATVTGIPAAGRIIEGWTCHAGWPEYRGLAAPAGQPVLALVGEHDPWFRAPVLSGDCGAYMQGAGQRSIVFQAPNYLAQKHWLSNDPDVQQTIIGFIDKIANKSGD